MKKDLFALTKKLKNMGLSKESARVYSILKKVAEEEEEESYLEFDFSNNYGPRRTLTDSAKKVILMNIEMSLMILGANQGRSEDQDERINKHRNVGALLRFIESERFLPEALEMSGRSSEQSMLSGLERSDRMGVSNKVNEINGNLFSIYNESQGEESFDLRANSEDIDHKVNMMVEFLEKAKEFYSDQGSEEY